MNGNDFILSKVDDEDRVYFPFDTLARLGIKRGSHIAPYENWLTEYKSKI